jgi:hypothetical protein
MKTFREYLLERRAVDLYHGTTTGKDDATLQSFRDSGIKPHSASGHGQGSGYYSFSGDPTATGPTKAKRAINQAVSLLGPNSPKTWQQHAGNPMVVVHQAKLNPKEYQLDAEIQHEDLMKFVKSNLPTINKLLESNPITISENEFKQIGVDITIYGVNYVPKFNGFVFWNVPKDKIPSYKTYNDNTNVFFYIDKTTVDDAADLNAILKNIFEKFPELQKLYRSFSRVIMKRTAEGRAKPRAWKYVGDEPLKPTRLNVGTPQGWSNRLQQ